MRAPVKKVTRIFVARIAPSVTEATFRRYNEFDIFIKIIGSIFLYGVVVSYTIFDAEEWWYESISLTYFFLFLFIFFPLQSFWEVWWDNRFIHAKGTFLTLMVWHVKLKCCWNAFMHMLCTYTHNIVSIAVVSYTIPLYYYAQTHTHIYV